MRLLPTAAGVGLAALGARLVDRVAYWDVVLDDLRSLAAGAVDSTPGTARTTAATTPRDTSALRDTARKVSKVAASDTDLLAARGSCSGNERGACVSVSRRRIAIGSSRDGGKARPPELIAQ